jgi:transcriptional regulator with XRE-family HTH domain
METLSKVLGKRIRDLRTNKGISQEKLAELAGLHFTYIGQVERAEKTPTVDTVGKIARGLGIPMAKLFENIDEYAEGEPTIPMKCYEIVASVSEERQEQLYEMLEKIEKYGKTK